MVSFLHEKTSSVQKEVERETNKDATPWKFLALCEAFFFFIKIEYSIFHGCLNASVYMIALFISVYFWKLIFVIFLTTSFISSTFSHNFSSSCYICVYALNDFLWEVDVYINAQCWSIKWKKHSFEIETIKSEK